MRRFVCAATVLLCLLPSGCKTSSSGSHTALAGTDAAKYDAAPPAATTGTITGTVQLHDAPPARVSIDMSQDPACAFAKEPNLSEQYIVQGGKLANVFVYVKGAPRLAPPAAPVVVDQHGCRFVPHVAAVAAGGSVEFRNSDPAMHNVHTMAVEAGNRNVDVSQGPGAKPQSLTFRDAENMLPVRCNNHPWMNAFINVAPNTFFAVTDDKGAFRIAGVPQGTYDLVFVHEKLGEQHVQVTVKAQADVLANATFAAK